MARSTASIKHRREYQKRWKVEHRAKNGQKSYTRTRFQSGKFITFDGEGKNVGELVRLPTGPVNDRDQASHHVYDQIQLYYDGRTFERSNFGKRLTTFQILDTLLEVSHLCPDATAMVGYGLSYDFTHILHDLDQSQLEDLFACSKTRGTGRRCFKLYGPNRELYMLEYRERKYLACRYFADGKFFNETTKMIRKPDKRFCLWDCIGFFQCKFTKAIADWLGEDYPDYKLIVKMKALRGQFADVPDEEIRRYNMAEVEALALIMQKLWKALTHEHVNLVLKRWDGAGAIAAAIFEKFKIKKHLRDTQTFDPVVFQATRHAFAGGHIEAGDVGFEMRRISHSDIISAYPYAMCHLPSLSEGTWQHGIEGEPPRGLTLVRIDYRFKHGQKFYPLFWRSKIGSIKFPRCGEGWYWFPEYEVAKVFAEQYGSHNFEVLEWYHWQPATDVRPFAEFVLPYFNQRAALKASTDARDRAAQIIIKLGLNSLYGKLCQQLGAEIDENGDLVKRPPYFQLEYAGYVTSFTRAKLFTAAMPRLKDVILFATDGIYSRSKPDIQEGKKLGDWEHQWHDGMMVIAPGNYQTIDGDKRTTYTRGFEKSDGDTNDYEYVLDRWEQGEEAYKLGHRLQMITLRQSLKSKGLWPFRGCFRAQARILRLDGKNSKRQPVNVKEAQPHRRLVPTKPQDQYEPDQYEEGSWMSAPYRLGWKALEREGEDARPLAEDDYN